MKKYLTTILVVLMAVFLAFAATSCGKGKTDSSDSVSCGIPSEEISQNSACRSGLVRFHEPFRYIR